MRIGYLLIGLLSLCFLGCPKQNKEIVEVGTTSLSDKSRHFFYAWLADCVNDKLITDQDSVDALQSINKEAHDLIAEAIKDQVIIDGVGKHSLVWGPVAVIGGPEQGEYTPKNLAYCLKREGTANSPVEYVVGIAGTNPLSAYDWFEEDLNVTKAVSGPDYWDQKAKISQGSLSAMNTIKGLKDSDSVSLYDRLKQDVKQGDIVSISGHSLGGALTQVLSYDLQLKHEKNDVSAWVYAGPSAGDAVFAARVVAKLKGKYHAYNNEIDVIPHAWQKDKLEQLCKIYNNFKFRDHYSCSTETIEEVPPIDGLIQYFRNISNSVDYQTPEPVNIFKGEPLALDFEDCETYNTFIKALWDDTYIQNADYYNSLNTISNKCKEGNIVWNQFEKFFAYLAELGYQHTVSYSEHFFAGEGSFSEKVDKYVPGMAKDEVINYFIDTPEEIFADVLDPFLAKIANGLPEDQPCGCAN
ncbi:hypothetical protein CEQ90_06115 [Lewinellaceae bacterium SD302]|nr:hypothetical protein CEQ90_06115 [Lewinellaceae bacterium SD302]